MTRHGRRTRASWVRHLLLAAAVLSGGAAAADQPAAAGAYRFLALACVDLDLRCPTQAPVPGLAVTPTVPPTAADLVTLLKAPAAAAEAPAPATPWLVAIGPLQATPRAGSGPRLRSLKLEGQSLVAELDYVPYSPVGEQRRRHVPSYPVACISLPPLPSGAVQLSVRWTPRDAPGAPTLLGPLRLLVP